MSRVLVVDDESDLAELVRFNLQREGLDAETAATAEQALEAVRNRRFDLVVLDVMLPDVSGVELCRRLKADAATRAIPVVMLTARGDEADRVRGLEAGAEDYVTKPFSVRELVLRVKAVLRRGPVQEVESLSVGRIRIEPPRHRCYVDDEEVSLTPIEFRLLAYLMARPGRVQSRERLMADLWGANAAESRTLDMHVLRLRAKLKGARAQLETVRGVGFRLVDAPRK